MPQFTTTRRVRHSAEHMFDLVADVERYPEFLPWCTRLKVLSREKDGTKNIVTAEMVVSYKAFRERYISRVTMDPATCTIEAAHVQGPFQHLDTRWRFTSLDKGTEAAFFIDFAFKSPLLSAVANVAFGYVAARMTESFVARAEDLYGAHIA